MKNKKVYILILFIVAFVGNKMFAQVSWTPVTKDEMSKVFEQMNSWFKNTSDYSLTVTHASYKDYKTTVPAEKSVGYFKKDKNNNYHSFLLGIHTIQNANYKIVVDSMQKVMVASYPDKLVWTNYTLDDYTYILNSAVALKMTTYSDGKLYRIEFNKSATIASYEFLIDSDNLLSQIIWYYAKDVKHTEDEKSITSKPRLCITFSNLKKNPELNFKEEFDESKYFFKKDSKLVLSEKYKKYKFIDSRVESIK